MSSIKETQTTLKNVEDANITLIYKEGNGPKKLQSPRTIFLLNVDYKIFTILAECLRNCVSEIIHADQTSYIPKRKIKHNSRFIISAL